MKHLFQSDNNITVKNVTEMKSYTSSKS